MNGLCRQQFGQFSIFLLELIQPLLLFKRLTEQCFSGFESEFVGSEFILFFFQGIRDAVYDLVTELQDRDALENNAILIQPVCCLPLKEKNASVDFNIAYLKLIAEPEQSIAHIYSQLMHLHQYKQKDGVFE